MSKFCENCGAEMADDEVVCKHCGPQAEPVANDPVVENTSNATSSANSNNTKNIAIIAGIAAVVIILVIVIFSIFGKGWKKPIDNYFKGMEKGKVETYLKAYPEFMDMDENIDEEYMEDMLDEFEDEYGEKIKISYEVTKKEKIEKDDLKDVQEYIKERYEEDVKVSKGYELKVKATIKGKDDEDTDSQKMYVYKIDGKWKYFSASPDTAKDYLDNLEDEE